MDYQTFVGTQFVPRVTAMLEGLRSSLAASGVNNAAWTSPDSADLMYRFQANRQGRTLILYIELTDNTHLGGSVPGNAVITVWIEGNGNQITHSYTTGPPRSYDDDAGIDFLIAKIAEAEVAFPDLVAKARAFLRV